MFSSDLLRLSCLQKVATTCLVEKYGPSTMCACICGVILGLTKEHNCHPLERFCPLVPHSAIGILFLVILVVIMANSAREKGLRVTQGSRQSCLHPVALYRMGICTSKCVNIFCPSCLQLPEGLSDWRTGMWTLFEVDVNLPTGARLQGLLSIPNGLGRPLFKLFKCDHLCRDLILQYALRNVFFVSTLSCFNELQVFDLSSDKIPCKPSICRDRAS